ncbi:MAG: MBL fold metallo-hydrolase [Candidatus Woesearchaeota archaeon]
MILRQIEDKDLAQYSYLVGCQKTKEAIIVDPQRDIQKYFDLAKKEGVNIVAAVDTHIHADYITGLREFANKNIKVYGSKEGGSDWQYEWLKNSSYNYELIGDKAEIKIGNITLKAVHTPGHTPEHLTFLLIDHPRSDKPLAAFTGDFIFVGDVGRPDLLESAAKVQGAMEIGVKQLFESLQNFKKQDEDLMILPGHGSGSACGKSLGAVPFSTLGYEIKTSEALSFNSEKEFVEFILKDQPAPPMYFARMKKENKEGPELYNEREIPLVEKPIGKLVNVGDRTCNTGILVNTNNLAEIAGSYLDKEDKITLLTKKEDLQKNVNTLMKIGLDNVVGFLEEYKEEKKSFEDKEHFYLDVRGEKEYNEENLGTKLIPHTRLPEHVDSLDKSKKILVFCASGGRAESAASYLRSHGFDAENIGGIEDAKKVFKS